MYKLLSSFAIVVGLAMAPAHAADGDRDATVFKNPQCGCCANYVEHLRRAGFTVAVESVDDIAGMSRMAGIPDDFQGCHFARIDRYVVSGHVPLEAVDRLLDERPDIKGITLPGMPAGSPGMSGTKTGPLTVYTLGQETPEVYATY